MPSPTPEARDPELVSALEQAVRSHSKKHYNAGIHEGISFCIRELIAGMSASDNKKYQPLMVKLAQASAEAYSKSLDGRPR